VWYTGLYVDVGVCSKKINEQGDPIMYRPVENNNIHRSVNRHNHEAKPKNRRKIAKWKKLILLMFIVYSVFIGKGMYSQQQAIEQKRLEVEALDQQLTAIQQENEKLKTKEARLHDEDYIAEIARQNYYLSKPGEVLFIVPQGR